MEQIIAGILTDSYTTKEDYDCPGNDILEHGKEVDDQDECEDLCTETGGCVGYEFNRDDVCFLKYKLENCGDRPDQDSVSGTRIFKGKLRTEAPTSFYSERRTEHIWLLAMKR